MDAVEPAQEPVRELVHESEHVCSAECRIHYEEPTVLRNGKFFFFGCWNRRDDILANRCTDVVVQSILDSQNLYREQYDFGVILGDNIYPDEDEYGLQKVKQKSPKVEKPASDDTPAPVKEKTKDKEKPKDKVKDKVKVKKFTDGKMSIGMKVIDQIPVPLHIVLGNHDIESCKMLEMQMVKPKPPSPIAAALPIPLPSVSSQPSQSLPLPSPPLLGSVSVSGREDIPAPFAVKNWAFKSNLYETRYKFKEYIIKLIVIDTNVINNYIPEAPAEAQKAKDYDILIKAGCDAATSDLMITNPKIYYDKLKNMLLSVHNKDVDLIILAGHEPLFCVKEKETKVKPSLQLFLDDIMKDIRKLRSDGIESVYICADTHTFLDTTIVQADNYLRQIVSGTGGAAPDIYEDPFIAKLKRDPFFLYDQQTDIKTDLIVNCIVNSYGYCSFDLEKYITEQGKTAAFPDDRVCVSGIPVPDSDTYIDRSIMYRHNPRNTYKDLCFKGKAEPLEVSKPQSLPVQKVIDSSESSLSIGPRDQERLPPSLSSMPPSVPPVLGSMVASSPHIQMEPSLGGPPSSPTPLKGVSKQLTSEGSMLKVDEASTIPKQTQQGEDEPLSQDGGAKMRHFRRNHHQDMYMTNKKQYRNLLKKSFNGVL